MWQAVGTSVALFLSLGLFSFGHFTFGLFRGMGHALVLEIVLQKWISTSSRPISFRKGRSAYQANFNKYCFVSSAENAGTSRETARIPSTATADLPVRGGTEGHDGTDWPQVCCFLDFSCPAQDWTKKWKRLKWKENDESLDLNKSWSRKSKPRSLLGWFATVLQCHKKSWNSAEVILVKHLFRLL